MTNYIPNFNVALFDRIINEAVVVGDQVLIGEVLQILSQVSNIVCVIVEVLVHVHL